MKTIETHNAIEILNVLDYALECIEDGDKRDAHACIVELVARIEKANNITNDGNGLRFGPWTAPNLTTHETNQ